MQREFDIAIIGAGPGGYVAAIKAAQNGKKVALIEQNYLGGSCLNCGCIPTKTLLANADVYRKISHAEEFGIYVDNKRFDYAKMKDRKDQVIKKIRSSLESLLKANKIEIISGKASFVSNNELKIHAEDTVFIIRASKIIIATGSEPLDIKAFLPDHDKILNSTSILELTHVPASLAIVGGGYIGCEFASLFATLGSKVTIIEALPSIVSTQGKKVSDTLTKAFQKQQITILTNSSVAEIVKTSNGVVVKLSDGKTIEAEKALIAIGRKIVTDSLNLNAIGLATTDKGMIAVNEKMETLIPGIYAIGDVTGKAMLAHVASHQGIVAAANASSQHAIMHYHAVPAVIFTYPEIAMVGLTLEMAKEKGYPAIATSFPFQHHGKAIATLETEGFTEIIIDHHTQKILGATVVGHGASDLIGEMAIAIQNELTLGCVTETIHAHPTMLEGWLEAALLASDTPIHFPPKTKK
ncbi:MAG: dihydrolipoyl dehydrogenase [Chlamydiales bacterium]|nr:dihydrolipoyl dehydrogenase [Chlamydiales bacterium]